MDEVIAAEDTDSKTNRRNTECEQAPCYSDEEIFQNSKFIHNTNKCTFIYTSSLISLPLHGTHNTSCMDKVQAAFVYKEKTIKYNHIQLLTTFNEIAITISLLYSF